MRHHLPVCILSAGLLLSVAFAADEEGKVVAVRNKAEACANKSPCRALDFGSGVISGDSLKTYAESRMVVRFASGSRAELGPNSLLVLTEVKANGKKTFARWGQFDFEVKKEDSKGRFQVRTPVAVAGAEGTRFSIVVDEATGNSMIDLHEGILNIVPQASGVKPMQMNAGQRLELVEGKAPAMMPIPPKPVAQVAPNQNPGPHEGGPNGPGGPGPELQPQGPMPPQQGMQPLQGDMRPPQFLAPPTSGLPPGLAPPVPGSKNVGHLRIEIQGAP